MIRSRIRRLLFSNAGNADRMHVADVLRQETVGGLLMLAATFLALIWANVSYETYYEASHFKIGPMDMHHWAADGLLTVFFFVAGMELKHEFTHGTLSRPADALVPIVAAITGMVLPAAIYLGFNLTMDDGYARGWAVPMATDIAFALAVLAIVGSQLPSAVRAFLLTLAVVDDLGAIIIIAAVFTSSIQWLWLLAALAAAGVWVLMQRMGIGNGFYYVPVAVFTWWAMYQSGIHATIAGVLLGLLTFTSNIKGQDKSRLERWENRVRPWSAGLAVPIFALFAAGLKIEIPTMIRLATHPIALGITFGLIAGKTLGIFGGAWITARFTSATLDPSVKWRDVFATGILAGIGFTVSLLIVDLAFVNEEARDIGKMAVLVTSFLAAIIGGVALRRRSRAHSRADQAPAVQAS
ncbi:MAG: Na+/H+ antiporter NhaA [Propionibacteriales bacterium]|nr:MAG: Na+/H+ antiporter NhaA [Propionibacteriales bacterium]